MNGGFLQKLSALSLKCPTKALEAPCSLLAANYSTSPPTRPGNPFVLFLKDKQPQKPKNMAQKDFVKKQSKEWNMLNDFSKQRYLLEFEEEMGRYKEEKVKWMREVSDFERDTIKQERINKREARIKRKKNKEEREFNKPKLPLHGYSLFLKNEYKKYYIKSVEDSRKAMKEIATTWSKMSDTLKNRYKNKSVEDKSRYDQEMMEYVARLKQAQREDLVPRSMKKHLKNL